MTILSSVELFIDLYNLFEIIDSNIHNKYNNKEIINTYNNNRNN